VTIDRDRHVGHEAGRIATTGTGVPAGSAWEPNFMSPPEMCFGEGWRPQRPQGSGKPDDHQVYVIEGDILSTVGSLPRAVPPVGVTSLS
jgi:hypothetical protein